MSIELDRANSEFQGYSPKEIRDLAGQTGEKAVYLAVDAVASTVKAIALIVNSLRKFLDKKKETSLKDFLAQATDGKVQLSKDIQGSESEQVGKLIQLMNTPAGQYAPAGLEQMKVNVDGVDYIIVDEKGKVTQNSIQPLMQTETVKAMLAKNLVELPNAPNIKVRSASLAEKETTAQSIEIATRDLEEMETTVDRSTTDVAIENPEVKESKIATDRSSISTPTSQLSEVATVSEEDTLDPTNSGEDDRLATEAERLTNRAKTEMDIASSSTEIGDAIAARRSVGALDTKIDGLAAASTRSNSPENTDVRARISSADKLGNGLRAEGSTLDNQIETKMTQAEFNSKVIKPLPPIPPVPTQQQTL